MKKYTKLYMDYFGFFGDEYIPCETCNSKAVDIHHIVSRGMGGSDKDGIENLMALCRSCHIKYGDIKKHMSMLEKRHQYIMERGSDHLKE